MTQFFRVFCVLGACAAFGPAAIGEQPSVVEELGKMRATIELQGRQIEALAQQVGKLSQALDGTKPATPVAPVAPGEGSPPPDDPPKAEAVAKAESGPPGTKHIVVKGETLTSIAKHYNIPLVELQKANKIEDGRKLQIGQTLLVPPPRPPEPSTDKKENP